MLRIVSIDNLSACAFRLLTPRPWGVAAFFPPARVHTLTQTESCDASLLPTACLAELSDRAPTKTLADIIAFNEANREREMPYFEQEIFVRAEAKGPLTEKTYLDALARNHRIARDEGIDKVMRQHRLSAIVAPTGGPAWTTDLVNGDHFSGGSSSFAAIAGYPDITVPAGDVQGLPVGISFFAGPWSEPVLLGIAYAFEQATKFRRKPAFLASV